MLSIFGFLIMLAPLVVVHELGHFLFAKLFNVKAEAFSIGFGPRVWKRQIGETEWRVSAIPLGGYVKLLGEDPEQPLAPEERSRALQYQAPWKRFFIFFGGPLFNFLWAILVYASIMVIGEPQLATEISRILPNSAAEKAGFVSGDTILEVDGKKVRLFDEVSTIIDSKPEQPVRFLVSRKDIMSGAVSTQELTATPTKRDGFSVYGEQTHVGEIEGFQPLARDVTAGISNLDTPAAKAGMRTGDHIDLIAGHAVENWEQIETIYSRLPAGNFEIQWKSVHDSNKKMTSVFQKPTQSVSLGKDFGLYSTELFIDKAVEKSPALDAGIKSGDRMISVDGQPVTHFFALREAVQKAGETRGKAKIVWEREGKLIEKEITPNATTSRDALLNKQVQFTIGIIPLVNLAEPKTIIERTLNPFMLAYKGTERMLTFTYRNFVSIKKMFTGDVSMATLGGPILIGKIAGESLSRGLLAFLGTMAILSIGLGVLNILPIPVLDGGHILLLLIESVRGKPLSMKQLEAVQMFGLSIIAALMFVVLKNDLTRLPFFN